MGSQVSWLELRGEAWAEPLGGRMVIVGWAQETGQREKGGDVLDGTLRSPDMWAEAGRMSLC